MHATWEFATVDDGRARWDWRDGPPEIKSLVPVRYPSSRARSRHVPARAFCMATGGYVLAESGLEHDLVRLLDRSRATAWLVAQPARLRFEIESRCPLTHIPDLVSMTVDGTATIWDCRAEERQDDDFRAKSALTRVACAVVGWRYEVFVGQPMVERLNERWLGGFRRPRLWHERQRVILLATARDGTTLGDLLDLDDGSGELISTAWHLLWTGELKCNLAGALRRETAVAARSDG
ncbi:TnsA-like heteromeric transposase endonuclease subunit [Cellulomonas humilata]|uniref:TnsA-like heteromeric transposase endonuclease subunit n=1 Tax=Cellulomonas humilata TaxID=144055 RepID=A0A7Y6A3I5_9CELL|nr:TnsA-like heteromeric transposase endonuclease subunit [Cellulomonas humilata]NUU19051.1 TnsA-like heteromeric transposase endonuclease subunit [Cellulomonas humilata]